MPQPSQLKSLTAREIRERMPNPDTLDVMMIPGSARRELYRAMQAHASTDVAECLNALDSTSARITRDQYFQISHVIGFAIHDWLKRNSDVTARGRQERAQSAIAANAKARAAIEAIEALGYAWHPPSKKFMKVGAAVNDQWE